MPTIQAARLMSDLRTLAEFGRYRTGVHRPSIGGTAVIRPGIDDSIEASGRGCHDPFVAA